MIHFAWPLIFLCLPLPLMIRKLFSGSTTENSAAVKVPFFAEIKAISGKSSGMFVSVKEHLLWVLWVLLVISAARPQIPDGLQSYTVPVRDIILAVDISRSMLRQDLAEEEITRLDVVKQAAGDFINMRQNDRVGIILFSEQTNLYVPLTVDTKALTQMLGGVQVGLLGSLTAVGDALGLSLQYLEKSQAKHKVVILLTDGLSNAGNVAPEDALEAAKKAGVTIYTIGVGSPYAQDGGADIAFLQKTAQETNGLFFMATDTEALMQAYARISDNEPLSKTAVYLIPQKELYFWPLLVFALIISGVVFKRAGERIAFKWGKSEWK